MFAGFESSRMNAGEPRFVVKGGCQIEIWQVWVADGYPQPTSVR
jgi:hypothetical protein